MSKSKWGAQHIQTQSGKIAIITGANSGLGKEATKILASKNATVIMAVRTLEKGNQVREELKKQLPDCKLEVRQLDLGSLVSIESFAQGVLKTCHRLDILINNAGVMMCPFAKTKDGFEVQMGTNHLGHFALTGLLMPLLKQTKDSRIVSTSSVGHNWGNIDFEDLNWVKRTYDTTQAYADSKLANLYFAYELVRKLEGEPDAPLVTAAHPGYTRTNLQQHSLFWRILNPILAQNVAQGVLPTLRAAVDPNANSGDYYGPSGWQEMKGAPIRVKSNKMSYNEEHAKRLWSLSEEMTGVIY